MKKVLAIGVSALLIIGVASWLWLMRSNARQEQLHFESEETELLINNPQAGNGTLFKAGNSLQDAVVIASAPDQRVWLPRGNYFLSLEQSGVNLLYPIPLISYRAGPDTEGTFSVTVRPAPANHPPKLLVNLPDFVLVPSGHFLFGDHLRTQEPHYVWLTAFFISPFEVTNAEFSEFLRDPTGYADATNWTKAGREWKSTNSTHASAQLKAMDPDLKRFGQPDQPVVQVNWFEANAFCHWLTRKMGQGKWIFALPSEAEWEKAARGPDNFDYGLGMTVSDDQVRLYNWKKNPTAEVTVVGWEETRARYQANRYGLYHMTGNVSEWTQSIYRAYNRQHPYVDDDDRNLDETTGERVVRGGSWYTASTAVLYIPYRENFRPEVQTPYLGFRVVVRPIL